MRLSRHVFISFLGLILLSSCGKDDPGSTTPTTLTTPTTQTDPTIQAALDLEYEALEKLAALFPDGETGLKADLLDKALKGGLSKKNLKTVDAKGFVTYLLLSDEKLNGKIPEEIKYLEKLQALDLAKNQLTGELPIEAFKKLTKLIYVDISENQGITNADAFKTQLEAAIPNIEVINN